MGGLCHGSGARSGSAATASGALGTSGAGPGDSDVVTDNDNNDDDGDDYEDNALHGNNDNDDDNEALGEADVAPENENLHLVRMLAGVVRNNQGYGLGRMVLMSDASVAVPAAFKAVELQAPMFFALCLLMRARGSSEEGPPICLYCHHSNRIAPFLRCNIDSWTRCQRCS